MSKSIFIKLQTQLKEAGFYTGIVDGIWGPVSQTAFEVAMSTTNTAETKLDIAWSAKVSPAFVVEVKKLVIELGMNWIDAPTDLMSCMAFETGERFTANVKSPVSSATGLIQFMEATAKEMGTTTAALAGMTAEDQLRVYVRKYFMKYKGKFKNLGDIYMSILWPAGMGKSDSHVLWDKTGRLKQYMANRGLDVNKDGAITRAECLGKINEKKTKGLKPEYRRSI